MKKRNYLLLGLVMILVFALVGCGKEKKEEKDLITSDWTLVEYTVKGETMRVKDYTEAEKSVVDSVVPKFHSEDGKTCTFSVSGKEHTGTLSKEDGKYIITYPDTDKKMIAEISDKTLTIVNEEHTFEIVFETE